ncbi:hypothetical protein PAXINDRAFT_171689 [Paxillus involutus ATCC 200175]|uniref:Uncharacterized protein n=1 Tax=Paxillus involutus ATCC 200175 TaxID=664439 RepID=A0A0C9TVK1_PAXIN|nr:hypothetical protein PAXINDRAFT_171689 [Paxillus involutus ATCC 200175]
MGQPLARIYGTIGAHRRQIVYAASAQLFVSPRNRSSNLIVMSRQSDEPNKPPHQREMMMDDDSDDYEPEFHEEEDERSHIGRFNGRGGQDLTQASGKQPQRKPTATFVRDPSRFLKRSTSKDSYAVVQLEQPKDIKKKKS